ncbi:MAG TPA: NF038122 family metalloprotease [Phycisphaerae bacterium]|nr:NF038122 family metalloprotease [Phycisphaerae bacterium]HRW55520.1 NF038122 family metalloprotease [Phycisphaerae bacterium]
MNGKTARLYPELSEQPPRWRVASWRVAVLAMALIGFQFPRHAMAEHHTETTTSFTFDPATDITPFPPAAPRGGGFSIVINAGSGLTANASAMAAIQRAAAQWEAFITDPITVTIDADLANLGNNGIAGSTDLVVLEVTNYNTVRTAWINDADIDDGILASLPTNAQLSIVVPGGFTLLSGVSCAKANLKAIGGFGDLDSQFGAADATVTFNSGYAYDYDNTNGVGAGLADFETIAAHEIGHVLGFHSSVDLVDQALVTEFRPTTMDIFRFRNSLSNTTIDPDTLAQFSTATRDLTVNPNPISEFISGVGAEDVENRMSTGKFTGDGYQASHWKADNLTGVRIGMMEPSVGVQEVFTISDADLRMLDLIGYDIDFNVAPDCNNNGVDDATDIASGTSDDCNQNGTPDECELQGVIDQVNTPLWDGAWTNLQSVGLIEQTFKPQTPWLVGVDIGITDVPSDSGSDTITVEVRRGATMLASASTLLTEPFEGLARFDFPTAIAVTPGETLSLFISGSQDFLVFGLQIGTDTYLDGERRFDGVSQFGDWIFRTIGAWDANAMGADCNANGMLDECELAGGSFTMSDAPNIAIPDDDATGVSVTQTQTANGYISDIDVALRIDHTYQGDIVAILTHDGTSVDLIRRAGSSTWSCSPAPTGYGVNNFGVSGDPLVLDDDAAVTIDCYNGPAGGVANYAGPAMPHEPLSAFNGLNMAGDWTLIVQDRAGADIGTLVTWTLDITSEGFDCNGNGVPDDCDLTNDPGGDCDGNGIPDACETQSFGVFGAEPNAAIPDNMFSGVGSTITIPNGGVIGDVDLAVFIDHPDQGQIDLRLSHNGVTVVALKGAGRSEHGCTSINCGYGAADLGSAEAPLILDDSAEVNIDCYDGSSANGIPGYAGPAAPHAPLSAFNGMDMSGEWTLVAADRCSFSQGTFISWSIAVTYVNPTDVNGNGHPDVCDDGDECDAALPVFEGITTGDLADNTGATGDDDSCGAGADGNNIDEWLVFTPSASGLVTISTCHPLTDFDTTLSVFDGCPENGGSELACNDDTPGAPAECALSGLNRMSTIHFDAISGVPYRIRVAAFSDFAGPVNIGTTYEMSIQLCRKGDLTGDATIDLFDTPLFVEATLDPDVASAQEACAADVNDDGVVNGLDVQGFVEKLIAP